MAERLDLYSTLNLNRSSKEADIKRAYKKLALQHHPDKNKGTDGEFIAVALAYHVLSSAKLRAVYDMNEMEFSNTRRSLVDSFDLAKALEIFDSFFGTANPFAALSDGVNELFDAAEEARKPQPPPNINMDLVCTLADLYNGTKKNVAVNKRRINYEGLEEDFTKNYLIHVEPHWVTGTKLRFEKEQQDVTGDLVLTVQVEKDKVLEIEGQHLKCRVDVPLVNALSGVVIPITLPDKRILNISVEEVIDPAYTKVVSGEGLPSAAGGPRGDLLVSFRVVFPTKLSSIQKELISMALRFPPELTDENHIQRRLLVTAMKLPPNLADTERRKVEDVNTLLTKRDKIPEPE
mmetsp:Transcript_18608/g.44725  ORF Transcript_18608/g.44725 Transcript_18608/m.44725 type:complete len:348 (+) Transcript_18608:56-1099(+)